MRRRKVKRVSRSRARPPKRKRTAAPNKAAPAASTPLAKARARIAELEVENQRLREELAQRRGETMGGRSPDQDDGPLAPGM